MQSPVALVCSRWPHPVPALRSPPPPTRQLPLRVVRRGGVCAVRGAMPPARPQRWGPGRPHAPRPVPRPRYVRLPQVLLPVHGQRGRAGSGHCAVHAQPSARVRGPAAPGSGVSRGRRARGRCGEARRGVGWGGVGWMAVPARRVAWPAAHNRCDRRRVLPLPLPAERRGGGGEAVRCRALAGFIPPPCLRTPGGRRRLLRMLSCPFDDPRAPASWPGGMPRHSRGRDSSGSAYSIVEDLVLSDFTPGDALESVRVCVGACDRVCVECVCASVCVRVCVEVEASLCPGCAWLRPALPAPCNVLQAAPRRAAACLAVPRLWRVRCCACARVAAVQPPDGLVEWESPLGDDVEVDVATGLVDAVARNAHRWSRVKGHFFFWAHCGRPPSLPASPASRQRFPCATAAETVTAWDALASSPFPQRRAHPHPHPQPADMPTHTVPAQVHTRTHAHTCSHPNPHICTPSHTCAACGPCTPSTAVGSTGGRKARRGRLAPTWWRGATYPRPCSSTSEACGAAS
jgi:hypothetical protein